GGASGGFTSGRAEIIALLRNRSRPYLFSNSLAPMIVSASLAVMKTLSSTTELRDRLEANTRRFREGVSKAGFELRPGDTPIVPIMLGEARLAVEFADKLLAEGIYVIGFCYPVVPKGQARIRVQDRKSVVQGRSGARGRLRRLAGHGKGTLAAPWRARGARGL